MKIIDQFVQGKFPEKNIMFLLLLVVFILGIALLISGINIPTKNKASKIISILLGVLLMIVTLFLMVYVILFGINF